MQTIVATPLARDTIPTASTGSPTRGILLVCLAGVWWSLQGLTIRMIEVASTEQVVFWRAISQFFMMLMVVAVINRGRVLNAFSRAGFAGFVGGICSLFAGICFVFSLSYLTVATVVFMLAASPLAAALIAWLVMRERLEQRTIIAMLVAFCGIGIMMSEGIAAGNMVGLLFATMMMLGFAGLTVVARWGGGQDMMPAICWGSGMTVCVALFLTGGQIAIPWSEIGISYVSGGVLTVAGMTCFMTGARYVPAAVLAFLTFTEIILGPIWVWLAFNEVPGELTLVGGGIVIAAMAVEAYLRVRQSQSSR